MADAEFPLRKHEKVLRRTCKVCNLFSGESKALANSENDIVAKLIKDRWESDSSAKGKVQQK